MERSPAIIFDLADDLATQKLGRFLAELAHPGDVIALFGTLGAGKTTLARAFIRHLTHADEEVPSPTFTLVQTYDSAKGSLWHFDLYRLDQPGDIYELGFEDALSDICLIEWPERLDKLLPKNRLDVMIEISPSTLGRIAKLVGSGHWETDVKGRDLEPSA